MVKVADGASAHKAKELAVCKNAAALATDLNQREHVWRPKCATQLEQDYTRLQPFKAIAQPPPHSISYELEGTCAGARTA